jgi:transporter family protein
VNPQQNWILFALGSAFFAGLTALFAKIGVAGVSSNLATFIRTIVILLVTAGILSLRGEWRSPEIITSRTWVFLVLSGIATGLSWLCYFRALQLGPLGKVASVDKLSILFAIALGIVFAGESLSWPVAIGGGLIAAGAIVMIVF